MHPLLTFSSSELGKKLRKNITDRHIADEHIVVQESIEIANFHPDLSEISKKRGRYLVENIRNSSSSLKISVDELMNKFSLTTEEGIALMCLAESLIRIPDSATKNHLIKEKILTGQWEKYIVGNNSSFLMNAMAWGLLISKKIIGKSYTEKGLIKALTNVINRCGEGAVFMSMNLVMQVIADQFIVSENITDAINRSEKDVAKGYKHSFDMLGESALSQEDLDKYKSLYSNAIEKIAKTYKTQEESLQGLKGQSLSVKLSSLHPRYERLKENRVYDELFPRIKALCLSAKKENISITIDAEESARLELSLEMFEMLVLDKDLKDWDGLGFVVQSYHKRAIPTIRYLIELLKHSGKKTLIRLVKGAYWDSEIKHSQIEGHKGYSLFTRKVHTDVSYLACARILLEAKDCVYTQFATHNAYTISAVLSMAEEVGSDNYELQRLYGMGNELYNCLVSKNTSSSDTKTTQTNSIEDIFNNISCRIYAPVGTHSAVLPYLVRRILENGSNSSFVKQILNKNICIDELIDNPIEKAKVNNGAQHNNLPDPLKIYEPRVNSLGVDLSDIDTLNSIKGELAMLSNFQWKALPTNVEEGQKDDLEEIEVYSPSHRDKMIGKVYYASDKMVDESIKIAKDYFNTWSKTTIEYRARIINKFADLLEHNTNKVLSLCAREAGKSIVNGISEVREAVDFCRYYAMEANKFANSEPVGLVVCISPWNFPVAIFVGQIVAALSVGNVVVAKSAEQTSLVASFVIDLMYKAGVPKEAMQAVYGLGELVGHRLVSSTLVDFVLFTGSLEIAKVIQKTLISASLEKKASSLVAETGGQNAMIVDSSALLDHVVMDVITSAFDSVGQRCSALRVLCLQEEIYDRAIHMIIGAMDELSIGNPSRLYNDIGPVIDAQAQEKLCKHLDTKIASDKVLHQIELPNFCSDGFFVPPSLVCIDNISDLEDEVFGPVLHVMKYEKEKLSALIEDINKTNYGLTAGIHSRLNSSIDEFCDKVRSGNLYINRNIVGAIVGVQPFGGNGLSGTGPKAGGHIYLSSLVKYPLINSNNVVNINSSLLKDNSSDKKSFINDEFLEFLKGIDTPLISNIVESFVNCRNDLESRYLLSSYVGEKNTWEFVPKGTLMCVAEDKEKLSIQIAMSVLVGNKVLLDIKDQTQEQYYYNMPEIFKDYVRLSRDIENEFVDAIFFDNLPAKEQILKIIDNHKNVIAFITLDQNFDWYKLLTERTISNNISAIGGNADLINTIN